ncbi:MAG: thioesterase domain-containing protein, partial [Pyrinomonadaceae bacterium]
VANATAYVLDEGMEPAPVGVAGELYLGGVCLARGYVNRPGMTAEKFIPHPFASEPGERLYRTGDVVRYLPDGQMEFVGRVDHQVKVRGYRIELGEIESALNSYPGGVRCVAAVREDRPGEKRVVAYVVVEGEAPLSLEEVRGFARERLPEYMVPSAFVRMGEMPLTPSGKVDRRALPPPDGSQNMAQGSYVPPRDVLELQLTQAWEDLLGVTPVGVRDNFFDLGGHSLLAVRLRARTEQMLGETFALSTLFEAPTVEGLANLLRRRKGAAHSSPLVILQPRGTGRPFFCVHPGGGNVLCYAELSSRMGDDRPFYAFQSRGLDGAQTPLSRVEEMAAEYVRAMREVQPEGPYLVGGWSMGGVVAFEMARQLEAAGERTALLALLDTDAPGTEGETVPSDEDALLLGFAHDLGLAVDRLDLDGLGGLDSEARLARLWERASAAGLLPPEVGLADVRTLLDVFKANVRAREAYAPSAYGGEVTLFAASERGAGPEAAGGWLRWARAGVELVSTPGAHYTMLRGPHALALAELVGARLRRADGA